MRYILEVHQELVIGRSIVLSVHLRVTGQTGFCLKAQGEFRQIFLIFRRDFRALRTRSHQRHFPPENINQLGQFIDPEAADYAPHGRNARVLFPGGEAGNTVFFRVYPHTAEFQNVKALSILCHSLLTVQSGAAVPADKRRHQQHEGRQKHKGRSGEQNIKRAFQNQVSGRRVVTFQHHHGKVEEVGRFRPRHDSVSNAGDDIRLYAAADTVFDNLIALVAVDITQEHGVRVFQTRFPLFPVRRNM